MPSGTLWFWIGVYPRLFPLRRTSEAGRVFTVIVPSPRGAVEAAIVLAIAVVMGLLVIRVGAALRLIGALGRGALAWAGLGAGSSSRRRAALIAIASRPLGMLRGPVQVW